MVMETKFSIGDKVCTVSNYRIVEFEVAAIIVDRHGILYRDGTYAMSAPEYACFATVDSLIDYLKGEPDEHED